MVCNFRVILTCSHVWMTHWLIGAPELITCVLHCFARLAKQYKREWKITQIATKSATKGNHYFTTGMLIFLLAISTSQSWHWIRALEPQQCIRRHISEALHFILRHAITQHIQTHIADSSQSLFIFAISLNLQYVLLGRKSPPNRDAGVSLVVLYSIVVGIYCLMHTYTSTTDRELFDIKNLVKNSLFFGCHLLIHISR